MRTDDLCEAFGTTSKKEWQVDCLESIDDTNSKYPVGIGALERENPSKM